MIPDYLRFDKGLIFLPPWEWGWDNLLLSYKLLDEKIGIISS